jgi:hypothetical protein
MGREAASTSPGVFPGWPPFHQWKPLGTGHIHCLGRPLPLLQGWPGSAQGSRMALLSMSVFLPLWTWGAQTKSSSEKRVVECYVVRAGNTAQGTLPRSL